MIRTDMSEEFVKSGQWLVTMPKRDKYLKQMKVSEKNI